MKIHPEENAVILSIGELQIIRDMLVKMNVKLFDHHEGTLALEVMEKLEPILLMSLRLPKVNG